MTITNDLANFAANPVQGFRNKIINGNFDFWQRGTSTSTAGYLSDRWQTLITGSTFTSSRQSFTIGQTAVPYEPTYWHRTVVTSSAGSGNYVYVTQYIESVRTLAAQTATLSFWAKADASKNIAVEFVQNFGTGGSPSSAVTGIGVTTCALTTSWQKFTITVSIPSISGKTLGSNSNDNLTVHFWFDAGSTNNSRTNSLGQQSGTFDISQVQLEAGPYATPFEQRLIGTELSLCQRYYEKSYALGTVPGTNVGASSAAWVSVLINGSDFYNFGSGTFNTRKRGVATMSLWSTDGTAGTMRQQDASNITGNVIEVSETGFRLSVTGGAGAGQYCRTHWTASAEL